MQTQRGYSAVDLNYLRAALCKLNPSLWYYIWETSTSFISLFRQVLYDATLRSQISCTSQGSFAFSRSSMRIDCISTFWFFIESIVKEHSFKSKFLSVEVIGVNADPSASRSVSKHLVPLLPSDYSPSAGVAARSSCRCLPIYHRPVRTSPYLITTNVPCLIEREARLVVHSLKWIVRAHREFSMPPNLPSFLLHLRLSYVSDDNHTFCSPDGLRNKVMGLSSTALDKAL